MGQEKGLVAKKLIPFASSEMEADQLLCLQLGDAGETVIVYDTSDSSVMENTGFSYGGYLENIRDKLL